MADPKAGNVPGRAGGAPLRRTRSASGQAARPVLPTGSEARRIAIDALLRVDADGAYANVALTHILSRAKLSTADTGFVTELVYGTTRMRRSCDWLVDRFLLAPVEPAVRAALRCGAYQIVFLRTPPHAAVSTTVEAVRGPARKLVNAVLRRVAEAGGITGVGIAVQGDRVDHIQCVGRRQRQQAQGGGQCNFLDVQHGVLSGSD